MITDIINLLGFLRDIDDANKRQEEEEKLFKAVKTLIIEFLELVETREKQIKILNGYRIHFCLIANDTEELLHYIVKYDNISLLLGCIYILQKKYKLTNLQMEKILIIIKQIKPLIINECCIKLPNIDKIAFIIPDSEFIFIEDEYQNKFINLDKIPYILNEVKNSQWDNFIQTAIKELG